MFGRGGSVRQELGKSHQFSIQSGKLWEAGRGEWPCCLGTPRNPVESLGASVSQREWPGASCCARGGSGWQGALS